jgi:hypothetical protein
VIYSIRAAGNQDPRAGEGKISDSYIKLGGEGWGGRMLIDNHEDGMPVFDVSWLWGELVGWNLQEFFPMN